MYRTSKVDFVVIEEAVLEIEAQYERFKIMDTEAARNLDILLKVSRGVMQSDIPSYS